MGVATIVTFHAHPDDEAIATGGIMKKYSTEGHRVVLVLATKGEHGEVAEGVLEPGEALWQRRVLEVEESARQLGVARVEFLGYVDSGMIGTPENEQPDCFWQADVDEAASRLAAILTAEKADVLTVYDENGGYGHPDHIQVHRVGLRAGELASTPKVYASTINRDRLKELYQSAPPEAFEEMDEPPDPNFLDYLGLPADRITTTVDVRDFVAAKRASMAAHASQISETSFFMQMPDDVFRESFGDEWFVLWGAPPGTVETDLLSGL